MWPASRSTPGTAAITSSALPTIRLRRPTEVFFSEGTCARELLIRTYGVWRKPTQSGGQEPARQGCVQLFDQAGVVTSEDYDFKGNLLRSAATSWPDDYKARSRLDQ